MPESTVSVVPIGAKVCKPFILEVMVLNPESGFKFKVQVERSCTPQADAVWKLVFDLYKVGSAGAADEVQLVHLSYTAGTPVEAKAVQAMVAEGVKPAQATVLTDEVFPAAKAVVGKTTVTKKQKDAVLGAMGKVVKPVSISN